MLCANFCYSRRGWPLCQECWHGYFFSDNLDREPYYYGVMEDLEGIPWNYNTKYELSNKHLTSGMHLFITFLGLTCHFCNLQYRLPKSSANDRVVTSHITSFILDAIWGREPSTIKNHMLEVNRNFIKFKAIVKAVSYPSLGPHPVKYLFGMSPLVYMLIYNHQKYKIAYVPLDPVADYVYIADLNTRLNVG